LKKVLEGSLPGIYLPNGAGITGGSLPGFRNVLENAGEIVNEWTGGNKT
jgi:hypothetical protein